MLYLPWEGKSRVGQSELRSVIESGYSLLPS